MRVQFCEFKECLCDARGCCDSCDTYFCDDHGTPGGDQQVQEVGAVAYPSQCWKHGGFNVDE